MKCPIETQETPEVLLAYSAGRLDSEAHARVASHVASCTACRQVCEGQRRVWEALETWEAVPVAPDFDRRLYQRIEREARAPWWRRVVWPPNPGLVRRGIPIAAAAGLLLIAGGLIESTRPPADTQARVELQADQVERTLEDLELLHTFSLEVRPPASSL